MATRKSARQRTYRDSRGRQQTQLDYVAFGSDQHARLLGLRKAIEGDPFVSDGWAFVDPTQFGAAAQPYYIEQMLAQRVRELTTAMPEPQSDDPFADNYAPRMFDPDNGQTRIVAG